MKKFKNQLTKSNTAIPFCKICFKDIKKESISTLIDGEPILCQQCFYEMCPRMEVNKSKGLEIRSLYLYNEKIRSLLFQYKGCYDIELSDVFLTKQTSILRIIYHNYVLCPAPSYKDREEKRGFNHVALMFKQLGLPMIYPFDKTADVKQADLNYVDRQKISNYIVCKDDIDIKDKKILFVDDLITTGATAGACAKLLIEHGAKKVKVLTMARTANKKENKKHQSASP